jgi:hypothetical protein
MKGFSFFEVEKQFESLVFQSFSRNIKHDGTLIKVEISNEKPIGAKRKESGRKEWDSNSKRGSYSSYKKKDEGFRSEKKDFSKPRKKHRKGSKPGK